MATRGVIVTGSASETESRLARLLGHFGVRPDLCSVEEVVSQRSGTDRRVLFSSLEAFAALSERDGISVDDVDAVYVYPTSDRAASERALRQVEGWTTASLGHVGADPRSIAVSSELGELESPMSGITVKARLQAEDFVLVSFDAKTPVSTLVTVDGTPVFLRFETRGVPIFFCTSAVMVDIDRPVTGEFFDVKDHFCSLVPVAMFISWAFRDCMWRPFEIGACLIVDDPLLKPTYGFCDFGSLLELMNRYDFTTNVAFIPWNWRRTSRPSSEFFRRESRRLSVSIHGCDHTAGEFGVTSVDALEMQARLAQTRMQKHQTRTGIAHEAIMVFPQGVFSSQSPGVLKRNGFIAAVNTELSPVDVSPTRTLIRDVMDVAIRRYSAFPIYTRRYAHHGVENFAFDTLIGKPCLIVSHHGSFKDQCAEVVDLVRRLKGLRTELTWRSLGSVVRRAGRRRSHSTGADEIEMYASELVVSNPSPRPLAVTVRKQEDEPTLVAGIHGPREGLEWTVSGDHIEFADTIPAGEETRYAVSYRPQPAKPQTSRPIRVSAQIAARRLLSEFRDEYWQKYVRR